MPYHHGITKGDYHKVFLQFHFQINNIFIFSSLKMNKKKIGFRMV